MPVDAATVAEVAIPLSAGTHAAIGAASGMIEVTLLHPSVAWKNALQVRARRTTCGMQPPTLLPAKRLFSTTRTHSVAPSADPLTRLTANRNAGEAATVTEAGGALSRVCYQRSLLRANHLPPVRREPDA